MRARQSELLGQATDGCVEIGGGTGLNLPHYPDDPTSWSWPSPSRRCAGGSSGACGAPTVERVIVDAPAEQLPFADGSVDTVVSTFVLCTVEHPELALAEIARVLRPDGQLLFIEHVRADSPALASWQDRLLGPWRRFAGGCRCNRATVELIAACGFEVEASTKRRGARCRRSSGRSSAVGRARIGARCHG